VHLFSQIKKQLNPTNGFVAILFNGRGGEDRTPADGVGDLKVVFLFQRNTFKYNF